MVKSDNPLADPFYVEGAVPDDTLAGSEPLRLRLSIRN